MALMRMKGRVLFSLLFILVLLTVAGCKKKETTGEGFIAVFVPGFVEGSPTYEMLVDGANRAVAEAAGFDTDIIEAGFNQAEWQEKLTVLSATGKYDLIITSNPAMPEICSDVAEQFPDQKFAVIDGYMKGHPQIHTVIFNQVEQAYLSGYMAGLVTKSSMAGADPFLKAGLIVGQQYPIMDQAIRPGFAQGFTAAGGGEVDFRVVGNWYDANKAGDLAISMFDSGVDVILTIAGGANQGVVKAAQDRDKYVLWFDSNGYGVAPGTVVGSSVVKHEEVSYETVREAIRGKLAFGDARVLGVKEGYVEFLLDDEIFRKSVPEPLRTEMTRLMERFTRRQLQLKMPEF